MSEWLVSDHRDGPGRRHGRALETERQPQGEHAGDEIDHAAHHVPEASHELHRLALGERANGLSGAARGPARVAGDRGQRGSPRHRSFRYAGEVAAGGTSGATGWRTKNLGLPQR